jgi:hypothetical protein
MVLWGAAALLLLLPLIAMQLTDEVVWSVTDFVTFGAILLGVGIPLELAVRKTRDTAYRAGAGVAVVAAFLLVWINIAVGILGDEGNPANLMYFGVIAVGIIGALVARFRPQGMARVLWVTALAQASVGAIALAAGLGTPENTPLQILALNGIFVVLFAGSAWLFRKATERPEAEPGSTVG